MRPVTIPEPARPVDDLARTVPGTRRHVRPDPVAPTWAETTATGLRKFNLGTIPASVTPPRTWRRAAWFAVGTAAFVVCALGFAAYALVGNPRRSTTIDALPGQPTQQLLINDLPGDRTAVAASTSRPPAGHASPTTTPVRSTAARQPVGRSVLPDSRPIAEQEALPVPGRPAQPGTPPVTTAPRSTVDIAPAATADPQLLGDRTEQYFAQVIGDPRAACELTSGQLRAEGPEGLEARYADVRSIEITEIMIDPNWSFTRSKLVLVHRNGTRTAAQRELTFSYGSNPKITGDTAA